MYIAPKIFDEYLNAIDNGNIDLTKTILLDNISEEILIYRYCRGLERDLDNLQEKNYGLVMF